MEIFFRKYFWTVHLLFIAVLAYMAARTINLFVEGALLPLPTVNARAPRAIPIPPLALLDIEKLAALTGLAVPAPEVVAEATQGGPVDMNSAPVKSGLRVRLLGTLLAGMKQWSLASIQDMNTQKASTFFTGDKLQTAEILEIQRNKVIVLNNGRREYIDNEAGSGDMAAAPPVPTTTVVNAPSGPPNSGLGAGIKAIDDSNYEVPRAEIDRTLSNLNEVAMQARIVPAFKDGVAHGFKLFSIRPDSIYSKLGVQNGDVIRRINGFDLNSPEKALEIYSKLKEASRIEIEIDRGGATQKKTVRIP